MKIKKIRVPKTSFVFRVEGKEYKKDMPTEGSAIAKALELALTHGSDYLVLEYEDVIGVAKYEDPPRAARYHPIRAESNS